MPGPTGEPVPQHIAHAIARDELDRTWRIETNSYPPNAAPREQTDTFINATICDDAGKDLLNFHLVKRSPGHTLLETSFFAGPIDGHAVTVSDTDREIRPGESKAAAMNQPDGKISDGDSFMIDRVEYQIRELQNIAGHENEKGIYSIISMGPFWESLGGKPLPAPYHGVKLKRDGSGAWVFHGPSNLAGAGTRLADILNQAQARYTAALETAKKHLK
jgi:hypothetical protein